MRVLIADNDIDHRNTLIKFLEENDHKVEEVVSVGEIIEKSKKKCPDLILLDSDVSGTKGSDIVRQVRQLGGDAAWNPIIIMNKEINEEIEED